MPKAKADDPRVVTGNWKDFKEWTGERAAKNINLLYRGQSDEKWKLQSSLHRLPSYKTMAEYRDSVLGFHDRIATVANREWPVHTTMGFLSYLGFLQHHGFPTPLLDWTLSPYVAAYFAFEGISDQRPQSDYVSLYSFDAANFMMAWKQIPDFDSGVHHVSVVAPSTIGNQKLLIQQGVFTLVTVDDVMVYMKELEASKPEETSHFIVEYKMPIADKPTAIRDLRLMGVTHMTLFPGVEGMCRTLKQQYFGAEVLLGPSFYATLGALAEATEKTANTDADLTAEVAEDS